MRGQTDHRQCACLLPPEYHTFSFVDADKYENESSKFARAYSASTTELTVDEGFESTYKAETKSVPQLQSITRSTSQPQLKKKRCNPFRCPVIRKQQDNPVVSRYINTFFTLIQAMHVTMLLAIAGCAEYVADNWGYNTSPGLIYKPLLHWHIYSRLWQGRKSC